MKQKVLFLMLLLLLGLAGGSVMAGEPVVERQAGVKNSSDIVYWYLPGVPAIPANPTADKWYDCGNESGYSYFNFTLPTKDVDGNPIDPEKLSYSIYIDGELFTFDAETYSDDLTEDLTEIPYSIYKNGWDLYEGGVYFYRTNLGANPLFTKRIGIQVHYTVDGAKNSSDIVYWTLPTDPAVPANPIAVSWEDKGSEGGYNRFGFTLPTTDVDGNPIDQMKLSYSIYTDEDQLFTFDAETYKDDIEEDLTEIPFSIYKNAWDFYEGAVYFYRTNAEGYEPLFTNRLGIQVHYTVAGVKNSSDIVYLYPLPAVAVNFVNNKDNSDLMTENADKKADATIEGRTIFAPSKWNTLCLPFDLDAAQLARSPLAGFEVKELDVEDNVTYGHITGYEADTKTLWLNFKDAEEIKAGKPYLVKSPETMDASKLGYEAIDGTAGFDNEGYVNLVDGSSNTKWCSDKEQSGYDDGWICEFKAVAPASVTGYALTTGGDTGNDQNWTRNPQKWTLEAKVNETDDWTLIDSRDVTAETGNADDALPAENTAAKRYEIAADKQGTYQYFRFKVSETGGDLMQLSELTLQGTYTPIDITNPVFKSVIIKSISPIEVTSEDKTVTFVGTYAPVVYEEEDKSVLFLQGEKLYYPDGVKPTTINSFRAYFPLNDIYGGTPEEAPGVHNFVLNFGDGETTGITTTKLTNQNVDWYSIDGRKLNQKPQQRGIYISNGRKVMVK
ncbi:MAG: hypothetical protein IJK94_03265 [Bacteroidaceae bacterium]|nr:hypothetical protein [Bacteroidaceae bacterium]